MHIGCIEVLYLKPTYIGNVWLAGGSATAALVYFTAALSLCVCIYV